MFEATNEIQNDDEVLAKVWKLEVPPKLSFMLFGIYFYVIYIYVKLIVVEILMLFRLDFCKL